MGTLSEEIHYLPTSVGFAVFDADEIRKLSKVEITASLSVNDLGQPLPGGLCDLRMGPYMRDFGVCATCHLNFLHCPGHLGHIELVVPVINPLFRSIAINLLSRTCLHCSALLYPGYELALVRAQLELLDLGLAAEALSAADLVSTRPASGRSADRDPELTEFAPLLSDFEMKDRLSAYLTRVKELHASGQVVRQVRNVVLERRSVVQRFLGYKPLKQCVQCSRKQPSLNDFMGHIVRIEKKNTGRQPKGETSAGGEDNRSYLTCSEARDVLRRLWERESGLLGRVFGMLHALRDTAHPTDCFFMETLPVTAPRLRPMNRVDGRLLEHTQTHLYSCVLECSRLLRLLLELRAAPDQEMSEEQRRAVSIVRGGTTDDKIITCWGNLQGLVDLIIDSDMNGTASRRLNIRNLRGVRQALEKKEGIFRMNMMGKRVDFAGRTVITPDPYLSVEEMGVPEVMARRLTYPETVTPQNVASLQRAVLNGPNRHPGANAIQLGTGVKVVLRDDPRQLASIAASLLTPSEQLSKQLMQPKIVHRHLVTGDVVLLNRQPTLHRPSIMGQRVRVLPGEKTFRLHYSNCKSYNADFDGDEMNLHLPQGEEARSEAYGLIFSPNHYLVPKDGTPLGGLIQDHVVAGVRLTMRATFLERAEYEQLVAAGLSEHRGRVRLLPPALLRPRPLWTGKQVISTLLINLTPPGRPPINLRSTAKLTAKVWQRAPERPCKAGGPITEPDLSEAEVIIRSGHLLCGVLDKQQYGAVPYSLVHGFYEVYGGVYSSRLLSAFSRLFTSCLQTFGFTLGVRDILLTRTADQKRRDIITQAAQVGAEATADALGLSPDGGGGGGGRPAQLPDADELRHRLQRAHLDGSSKAQRDLDRAYKLRLDPVNNGINKVCLPRGLLEQFPDNNLQMMVESGAKGSKVNTMQISCLLGQIELEGKRPPRMLSGKTLPSFAPYDLSPAAGGFVASRFMTGIRPQEYFFHCMAGREGLIDTAVKTSRSGYLQRCLIKHLEGLVVGYDATVRDSDGSVIQFRYGEDGCETQKVPYLTPKQLPFLADNHRALLDTELIETFKQRSSTERIAKIKRKVERWRRTFGEPGRHRRSSPFLEFSRVTPVEGQEQRHPKTNRPVSYHNCLQLWNQLENRKPFRSASTRCPDPADSVFRPDAHLSSVSERLDRLMTEYVTASGGSDELMDVLYLRAARAQVQPGEPVGLIAAQSVGEPSTQMTLNTFHFAGLGDMNVTLGIPRLREILSASRSIKTPSMEIPFRGDVGDVTSRARRLRLQLNMVTLDQVLQNVTVTEKERPGRHRMYTLRLEFLRRAMYRDQFSVTPDDVLRHVEDVWVRRLLRLLAKTFQLKGVARSRDPGASRRSGVRPFAGWTLFTGYGRVSVLEGKESSKASNSDKPEEEGGETELAEGQPEADQEPAAPAAAQPDGDDDDDSAEELEGDDDATAARSKARRTDEADYDSDESDADEPAEDELAGSEDEQQPAAPQGRKADSEYSARCAAVVALSVSNCGVTRYEFDRKHQRWCQLTVAVSTSRQCDIETVVREAARTAVIRRVPGISRAFVMEEAGRATRLCTEGINMPHMARYADLLDLDRMHCNDVHSMAATYGIEAAARTIVREMSAVFEVYGIRVSPRHLGLIADYMTFSGRVAGYNRSAMEAVVSPLQQMSFETTMRFLRAAVLTGQEDLLQSPSARLVMGQPFGGGTGMFSLVNRMTDAADP